MWNSMNWAGILSAIQFLTIIPCSRSQAFDARSALPYFPVCGLLIGAILLGIHAIAGLWWPGQVVAEPALDVGRNFASTAATPRSGGSRRAPKRLLIQQQHGAFIDDQGPIA